MVYHVLLYLASGSSGPAYILGPLSRAVSLFHAPSKLAFYMLGCLVAWLLGCLVAWLLGCLVAWLLGRPFMQGSS